MRIGSSFLFVMLAITFSVVCSLAETKPTFTAGGAKTKILSDGTISIPITIRDVSSLRACYLAITYQGDVTRAEFIATDYLHSPVVIPPKIDNQKKTIMIALSASKRVVTREPEGTLGRLVIEGSVTPKSLQIVEASVLDEDYKIHEVVENELPPEAGDLKGPQNLELQEVRETKLYQSYPNPANPTSTISFSLKDREHVTLRIYNVSGQLVRILVNDVLGPDRHDIIWDATDNRGDRVSSGIYFYELHAGEYRDQRKLVILK